MVRGKNEAEFTLLSFTRGRRLAWVTGPGGMRRMIGRNPESIVLGIGKERSWLREKIAEGNRWRLLVLPQATCVRADWDGLFSAIEVHYPEVVSKPLRWREPVRDPAVVARIDPALVAKAVKDDKAHSQHLTVERYLSCADTVTNARLFLWHSLGANEHFVGDGWATDPDTKEQVEEYLTQNVPVARIPGRQFIDLEVPRS